MTKDPRDAGRERSEAYQRARARGQEVGERARAASGLDDGLAERGAPVETSPYEKFFTGPNTVMAKPAPLKINTPKVILIGVILWAVALVVVLLVPALHHGSRHWWPWTCVAGVVLGLMGWAYVRRGRGNAEAA